MKFELNAKQIKQIEKWKKTLKKSYDGMISGRFEYQFTITSIGTVVKVFYHITKQELDVTDYDLW